LFNGHYSSNNKVNSISLSYFIYVLKQSNQIDGYGINKMSCPGGKQFLNRERHKLVGNDEFDLSVRAIYYYDAVTRN
jgi:hypothetical protein